MANRKVIQKVAYVVVGLCVVVLIGLTIYQQKQIKKLAVSQSPATHEEETSEIAAPPLSNENVPKNAAISDALSETPDEDIDELQYHLEAAEEELDMAQEELSKELDQKAELAKNALEFQRQMFKDPVQRKMLRNNLKMSLDRTYGSLFEKLNLPDEKLEALKDLLADQMLATTDVSMELADLSISDEKREEIRQRLEEIGPEHDEQTVEFLGAEDGEAYMAYKERVAEQQLATTFLATLGGDEKPTEAQKQALIEAMYEARKNAEEVLPFEERALSPTDLNEETVNRIMQRTDDVYAGYQESANAHLTASQAEQFEAFLNQRRKMQEMQIKISSQVYGSASSSTGSSGSEEEEQ